MEKQSENARPVRRPARILIVEDYAHLAELLRRLLIDEGYTVAVAHSTAEALLVDEAEPADLVISDFALPDGTAVELMHRLNERRPHRGLAYSGYETHEVVQACLNAGYEMCLPKPMEPEELIACVRHVLGG